jgi:2-amino-4-hydroxy-6-hydroxymethyldihydropteridine diphosphokinase
LGSNLGDRDGYIRQALERLRATPSISDVKVSTVVETAPLGPVPQGAYLNAVAGFTTTLSPWELLDRLLAIERDLGRVRGERWGPRTIDLDILFYGDQTVNDDRLTIPHPEIARRPFVQAGLRELGRPV